MALFLSRYILELIPASVPNEIMDNTTVGIQVDVRIYSKLTDYSLDNLG